MSRTPAAALAWVLETDPSSQSGLGADGWSQDCGRLVVRSLDVAAQGDAIDAMHLATIVGTDLFPPYGAIPYWDNGRGVGHVGVVVDHWGSVLMTDAPAGDQFPGKTTAGVSTIPRYNAKGNGFRYVGWAKTYGRAAINTTDAAGVGGIQSIMTVTPEDLTAMSERLRHSTWLIDENGKPQQLEAWLHSAMQRIVGYGFRTQRAEANSDALLELVRALDGKLAGALAAHAPVVLEPVEHELDALELRISPDDRESIAQRVVELLGAKLAPAVPS